MGMAQDTTGRGKGKDLHSVTKLQPVPARTESTKTVRLERGVAKFRRARSDNDCRAFIRDQVVPLLRRQPEQMMSIRFLYPELDLTGDGLTDNQILYEQIIGGGQSFANARTSILSGRICSR